MGDLSAALRAVRSVHAHNNHQNQSYKFRVRPGGREWTGYGPPRSPNVGGPARAFSYDKADGEAMMGAFPSTDILLSHTALRITSSTSPTKPTTRGALPLLRASLPSAHACTSSGTFTRREAHIHLWTRGDGPSTPDSARTMSPDKLIIEEEGEQTVFVNAANHPSGPNVPREYGQVDAGGVGFQPVVVDLLD